MKIKLYAIGAENILEQIACCLRIVYGQLCVVVAGLLKEEPSGTPSG